MAFYAHFVGPVVLDGAMLAQWGWNGSAGTLVPPRLMQASITDDPPSRAAGEGVTASVTILGPARHFARSSFSLDLEGTPQTAWVLPRDTVSVRLQNGTAGAVDLAR